MVSVQSPAKNDTTGYDFVTIAKNILRLAEADKELKRLKAQGLIPSQTDRKEVQALSKEPDISPDDRKRLGEPLYRAIEYFPKVLQDEVVKLVKQKKFIPADIEEIKFSVGGPARIDDGITDPNTGKPILQLVDNYEVTANDLLKVKQNLNYDEKSQRAGHLHPDDTSRFSFSYDNAPDMNGNLIPTHLTIRIAKPEIPELPNEMKGIVDDAIKNNKKILFLGQTGVGKTTLMKMITKYLDEKQIETYVFDKSKEIGGHKPQPLKTLGKFVRRFVNQPLKTMSESIVNMFENHNPKVGLFDELSDKFEFEAVRRSIVEKGMPTGFIFIHGRRLAEVMKSENIGKLLAPIKEVIVGDAQAEKSGSGNVQDKTRYNLVGKPMVDVVIEMRGRNNYVIHEDTEASMKALLEGKEPLAENVFGHDDLHFEPLDYFIEPADSDAGNPMARPGGKSSKVKSFNRQSSQREMANQSPKSLVEQMVQGLDALGLKSLADSLREGDLKNIIPAKQRKEWLRVIDSALKISEKSGVTTTQETKKKKNYTKVRKSELGSMEESELNELIRHLEGKVKGATASKGQQSRLKKLRAERLRRDNVGKQRVERFNKRSNFTPGNEKVRITSTDEMNPSVEQVNEENDASEIERTRADARIDELRLKQKNEGALSYDELEELEKLEIELYANADLDETKIDDNNDLNKAIQNLAEELTEAKKS
ncbi:MAG: hypothetical protein HRT47_13665 [Candidatus Caenarcaniphilales bacterium]|nr:hypothetical protein [Candidatus Caenarcaniphilales bacterium]